MAEAESGLHEHIKAGPELADGGKKGSPYCYQARLIYEDSGDDKARYATTAYSHPASHAGLFLILQDGKLKTYTALQVWVLAYFSQGGLEIG